jgi:hypothetical protein
LGFQENFTKCFVLAEGKFLKYLNDDDVLLPRCVSRMANEFETHGHKLKLVTSRRHVINDRGELCPDIEGTRPIAILTSYMDGLDLGNLALSHSTNFIGEPTTVMFKKEDIELHGRNIFALGKREVHCLADLGLWLRLLSQGGIVYIVEPLSLYRVHHGQEQKKMEVGVTCVTDRLALVLAAKELGFLQSAKAFDHAMRVVEAIFLRNLLDQTLAPQATAELLKV